MTEDDIHRRKRVGEGELAKRTYNKDNESFRRWEE